MEAGLKANLGNPLGGRALLPSLINSFHVLVRITFSVFCQLLQEYKEVYLSFPGTSHCGPHAPLYPDLLQHEHGLNCNLTQL